MPGLWVVTIGTTKVAALQEDGYTIAGSVYRALRDDATYGGLHLLLCFPYFAVGQMATFIGWSPKLGGVLQNSLLGVPFLHLATLDQITRYAYEVAVTGIEGQILVSQAEGSFYDVEYGCRVATCRGLEGKYVAAACRDEAVEAGTMTQVVVDAFRFVAYGDAHTAGDAMIGVDAHLGMEQQSVVGDGAVGTLVIACELANDSHDAVCQIIGFGIVAITLALGHEMVGGLCQSDESEHGDETVTLHQSFGGKEVALKESALLYDEAYALTHVVGHTPETFGEQFVEEVVYIVCLGGQSGKDDAREGITASGYGQDIVAGGDAVAVVGGLVGRVVADSRIGTTETGEYSLFGQ